MKNILTILGYLAAMFLVSTIAFKVNRYPGEEIIMTMAGVLLSIYFPVYILERSKKTNDGKPRAVNYALATSVFFTVLGATLKLTHLELGSLAILAGIISFCLIYAPLLLLNKLKEAGVNKLMYVAGILGMTAFPLGIFLRVYLGSPFGMQLFTVGLVLIFFLFLPLYITDKSITEDARKQRTETTIYTIIIGALLFFCLFRSIYPPKTETGNVPVVQQNKNE